MDPITIGLLLAGTAGSAITGIAGQNTAQKDSAFQNFLGQQNLRMSKAGRTDPYGNRNYYNEALNEWISQLSPMQNRIAKAGEHEQLLGLTSDAARSRAARDRMAEIGKASGEDYNRELAGFRYGAPPSEESIRDNLTRLIYQSRSPGSGSNIRTAGNLPSIGRSGSVGIGGGVDEIAQALLQARGGALNEKATRDTAHNSKYLPVLQNFAGLSGAGGNSPVSIPNVGGGLSGQVSDMARGVQSAYDSYARNSGAAAGRLEKAQSDMLPGLEEMARFLSAAKGGRTAKPKSMVPEPPIYF